MRIIVVDRTSGRQANTSATAKTSAGGKRVTTIWLRNSTECMGRVTAAPTEDAAGTYLMMPYQWDRGDPSKNEKILSHCATIANLFPMPMSDDERKVAIAQSLSDPRNYAW